MSLKSKGVVIWGAQIWGVRLQGHGLKVQGQSLKCGVFVHPRKFQVLGHIYSKNLMWPHIFNIHVNGAMTCHLHGAYVASTWHLHDIYVAHKNALGTHVLHVPHGNKLQGWKVRAHKENMCSHIGNILKQ